MYINNIFPIATFPVVTLGFITNLRLCFLKEVEFKGDWQSISTNILQKYSKQAMAKIL